MLSHHLVAQVTLAEKFWAKFENNPVVPIGESGRNVRACIDFALEGV